MLRQNWKTSWKRVILALCAAVKSDARVALEQGSVIAVVQMVNNKYYIDIDGSDPTKANKILNVLQQSGYAS